MSLNNGFLDNTNRVLEEDLKDGLSEIEHKMILGDFRDELLEFESKARDYIEMLKKTGNGEAIAQSILAMRHIEDSRMRYGKVIQYLGDGNSIYNK